MKTLLFAAVILCSTAGGLFATPVQWTAGAGGNGHYYEAVLVSAGNKWSQANAAAAASGGYLVTILSSAENAFVYSLISGNSAFWFTVNGDSFGPWTGGKKTSGVWGWVTGESFSYTNWGPGEPNNGNGIEDRICFFGKNAALGSTWDDMAGEAGWQSNLPHGYVVEWNTNPIPEPSGIAALLAGLSCLGVVRRSRSRT